MCICISSTSLFILDFHLLVELRDLPSYFPNRKNLITMKFASLVVLLSAIASTTFAFAPPQRASHHVLTSLQMGEDSTKMTTFREAEVLGLRLMQEGQFEDALKGKKI